MAVEAERLLAVFEARFTSLEKALDKAVGKAQKSFNDIEAAGSKAEDALARMGAKGAPGIDRMKGKVKEARVEVGNLAAQFNDIGVQLAGGQSPFLIALQQGTQITQALGPAGARSAVTALGGAFLSMLNPVSLATIAVIGLGGAAVQYFAEWLSSGQKTEEQLKKEAQLIDEVAKKWGDALPAVKAYADERARALDAEGVRQAGKIVSDENVEKAREQIRGFQGDFVRLIQIFGSGSQNLPVIAALQEAFERLQAELDDGEKTVKNVQDVQKALADLFKNTSSPAVADFTAKMTDSSDELVKFADNAKQAKERSEELAQALSVVGQLNASNNNLGALSPLTSADGRFLNPAEEMDRRAANTPSQFERDLQKAVPAINAFVDRVVKAESGGQADAKNPNSSATGVGQFVKSTWIDLFQRYFPDRAAGMSRAAVLALRKNADTSRTLIDKYARENAVVLQRAGVSVDEAALHLAHFLGAGDAAKVLSAASGSPLAGLISAASIKANPTILGGGRTVDDAIAYAQRRANAPASEAAGPRKRTPEQIFEGKVADVQGRIDVLNAELEAQNGLTKGINDYGYAVEQARIKQQLLNEAKQAGLTITPALATKIDQLAGNYARLSAQQEHSKVAQEELQRTAEEFSDLGRDVLGGFISDLRAGKDASEALAGALNKVADKLFDMLLNSLFATPSSGGGGGLLSGLIGSIFGGFRANGGPVSTSKAYMVGERGPEMFVPSSAGRVLPNVKGLGTAHATHVTFGVSADNNGNLLPFVESVSQRNVRRSAPQIMAGATRQVRRNLTGMMADADAREL